MAAESRCGACGREVGPMDNFCPGCGASLKESGAVGGGTVRCTACGYGNAPGAAYCVACGVRLETGSPAAQPVRKQRPAQSVRKAAPATRKAETWQIISGIAIVVLIVFLVYNQLGNERSASRQPAPANVAQASAPVRDLEPLRQAVARNPNDYEAVLHLANALYDNAQWSEAAQMYQRYLSAHPEDADARVDLGTSYYQMGMADSANAQQLWAVAVQQMESAYKGNPQHQQAAFNLGVVNLSRGDLEASKRWFMRAKEINSTSELGTRAQMLLEQHTFPQ